MRLVASAQANPGWHIMQWLPLGGQLLLAASCAAKLVKEEAGVDFSFDQPNADSESFLLTAAESDKHRWLHLRTRHRLPVG